MQFKLSAWGYLILILFFSLLSFAQDASHGFPPPQSPPSAQNPNPAPDENEARIQRDMAKKANQERQAQLKRDTDKLLKLATELKEYVDKTNENTLSLSVVKKAEEIEKLARSVKDKMKGE